VPFRWVIGLLLFASTVINYIDRQTLSVLAPYMKTEFHWSNTDFAFIIIAFRVAYAIGQTVSGRLLDRVGTRAGLMASVSFYSVVAIATSLATGFRSLVAFRFLLGLGESANWPGATKAVSEWFPRRESGWAVALFDSGSSIGGALAPLIVLGVYHWFGSWRPAFVVTGMLGFLWLLAFRALYRPPEVHERVSEEERRLILDARASGIDPARATERLPYGMLLRLPQTWGIVIGKALSDPVWFFITDWFAIYLVSRQFRLEDSLVAFWVPFLAADLGNFAGGGLSSWLISRGWGVGAARKLVVVLGGLGMTLLAPTVFVDSFVVMVACFAVATFSYAALSTMILNLPADVYPTGSVASVSGLSGTGAGIGTIAATLLTGAIADRMSFSPILIGASLIPLVGVAAILILVRNTEATRRGELQSI
jgi:ACS family hexuronate transporter-like MFS transporter